MQSARAAWERQARRPFNAEPYRRRGAPAPYAAAAAPTRPAPPPARQPSAIRPAAYQEPTAALAPDPGYQRGADVDQAAPMPYEGVAPYEEGNAYPYEPSWQPRRRASYGPPRYAPGIVYDGPEGPCFGECPGRIYDPCWRPFRSRLWLREEYILWWTRGDHIPPLVTSGPLFTGETIDYGNADVNGKSRSGIRDIVGYWLDENRWWGVEGTYFVQGSISESFAGASPTVLAFPYLNVATGAQEAFFLSNPPGRTGGVSVREISDLEGAEFLVRRNLFQQCGGRADLLVGYRYARLADSLRINANTLAVTGDAVDPIAGTTRTIYEQFDALNEFNGAEFGVIGQWQRCQWSLELLAKIAFGGTNSHVRIAGDTQQTVPPATTPTDYAGALHALPSNIGAYDRTEFSMIPELGFTISRDLGSRLRATMGYTLIYWGKVMRAGEQIDLNVNKSQIPPGALTGSPQPQFSFATNDLWIHGLNLGLECRF